MTTPRFIAGEHYYLSTSCFHDVHQHCRSAINIDGDPKTPGTCKWCPAVCICPCHHEHSDEVTHAISVVDPA